METKNRTLTEYFFITLRGIAMGAADVVPGVSGGTIAFISGIYEELISSISALNVQALKVLKKQGFSAFWRHINGNFFLSLFLGIAISVFSLAKAIRWLLENQPVLVWAFFLGLMLASILFVAKEIKSWNLAKILMLLTFCFLAYYITTVTPANGSDNFLYLFFAGALAICAMILPGISGAFILVLLGVYNTILTAIDQKNLLIISVLGAGALIGILTFSRVLKWLFAHYKEMTMAVLTGFIIGSLNKIWPWKQVLASTTDAHGKIVILQEKSVLPSSYPQDPQLFSALGLMLLGFFGLYFLEKWAFTLKK